MTVEKYFTEILKIILAMTFTGSIISIFLFAIKPIIKNKLPKSFQYCMWFPAILALILPVSKVVMIPIPSILATSMISRYDMIQRISDNAFKKPIQFMSACQLSGICEKSKKNNVTANQQETVLLNQLSTCKNTLKPYKNSIVATPILLGVFRPAIILPDKIYEGRNLQSIFMHEIEHIKRHDIAVKWLLIFAGALHWFNPMIRIVHREISKSCELSCDESVIKNFNEEEIQQYGNTLIAVAADTIRKTPVSRTMFDNKKNLKETLCAFEKKNIVEAYVNLGESEESITNATRLIICQDKNPSPEMKSGIQAAGASCSPAASRISPRNNLRDFG